MPADVGGGSLQSGAGDRCEVAARQRVHLAVDSIPVLVCLVSPRIGARSNGGLYERVVRCQDIRHLGLPLPLSETECVGYCPECIAYIAATWCSASPGDKCSLACIHGHACSGSFANAHCDLCDLYPDCFPLAFLRTDGPD